jgi:NAD-dependent dihydropyrimidine dehydrogenase PreA subunit
MISIQLKVILDILLCGFCLSSCPQHSLKALLLLNPLWLLKYVLNPEKNFSFSYFGPVYFTSGLERTYCTYIINMCLYSVWNILSVRANIYKRRDGERLSS